MIFPIVKRNLRGAAGFGFQITRRCGKASNTGAETDVRVDVRPRIIEVQCEHTRRGGIVPVATTDRYTACPRNKSDL